MQRFPMNVELLVHDMFPKVLALGRHEISLLCLQMKNSLPCVQMIILLKMG